MLSLPEQMPSLTSRIANLANRLGLTGRTPRARQILERASRVCLPFQPLPEPQPTIFWHDGPPLQHLLELPRGALSGPVKDDKDRAHAALQRLVRCDSESCAAFDLRQVDGVSAYRGERPAYYSLETFAATPACRQLRIISYKDCMRVLHKALPGLASGTPVELRQATWLGDRLYWAGDQHVEAFSSAIAYARLRGLELRQPARLTDYRLEASGLRALDEAYHVLAMPAPAWNDREFMRLLLDDKVPYARLTLMRSAGHSELLLLEKSHPNANALGEGLKLAGAPDMIGYLRDLPQITRFRLGNPVE
ncbi:DUF6685 family protein [Stutzerimonas azotifigens]|uniref:DUF6685 family protein n=1 Tax=Stutzerimonas azotifigens TaxID=291995 RepID=UPI00041D410B|nr:DUF6685 family protein [Stutzerimonas azotifigens]